MGARLNVFVTALSRLGAAALSAASAILIARALGKEGLGLFALLRAVPGVLLILTEMGVSRASPYLINNRNVDPQRVLGNALLAGCASGILALSLWTATSSLIASRLLCGLPMTWILAAGLITPLMVIGGDMQNLLRALQYVHFANLMRVAMEGGMLLALIASLGIGRMGAEALVPCILGAHALVLLLGAVRLVTLGLRPFPVLDFPLLRESLHFGVRGQVGNAINILNYRLDHLILGVLTNPGIVGIYVVATKAAELFKLLPGSVAFVLEPKIAKQSREAAVRTVKRLWAPVFLANLVLMIIAYFAGPVVIPFLFRGWSVEAVVPFHILLVGMAAVGANAVFASFNLGRGQPEVNTYAATTGLLFTVSLDFLLVPWLGVVGAAVASSASYAAGAALVAAYFCVQTARLVPQEGE